MNCILLNIVLGNEDLVLEDTLEGETFAGDGLQGVLEGTEDEETVWSPEMLKQRKQRSVAAPIITNMVSVEVLKIILQFYGYFEEIIC